MLDFPFSPSSSLMPQSCATKRTTPSDMWVLRLSQTTSHGAVGAEANRVCRNATKSASVRLSPMLPRTLPVATSNAAIRAFVPCRMYSNSRRSTCPGFIGRFDVSGLHRQVRGGTLQRLDTGHLVDRNGLLALFGSGGGGLIHRADIGALGVECGIRLGGQPVTVAMRLEIGLFFKKRPTELCEMLLTMPRATDCRASSL